MIEIPAFINCVMKAKGFYLLIHLIALRTLSHSPLIILLELSTLIPSTKCYNISLESMKRRTRDNYW